MHIKYNSTIGDILIGFGMALLCICVQQSPSLITFLTCPSLTLEPEAGGLIWSTNISKLPEGSYFVSAGSPRLICDLSVDNKIISSARSEVPGMRNTLFLGAGVLLTKNNGYRKLSLTCDRQAGFGGLTHTPVITTYRWGILLHFWRIFMDALLGPISSILILLSLISLSPRSQSKRFPFEGWRYAAFAITSLFYALSLNLFARFLFAPLAASLLHILLRNAFSVSVLLVFASSNRYSRWLIFGQVALLLCMILVAITAPETAVDLYYYEFFYCPVSCAAITFLLYRSDATKESDVLLKIAMMSWTTSQVLDAILLWTGVGAYSGPSLILLLCSSAYYLRNKEREQTYNIDSAVQNILKSVESNQPVDDVLREVAHIAREQTKYFRVSAYVDGFCLGASELPGRSFFRVTEAGYEKDTSKDVVINFSDGRGLIMREALANQNPILRLGKDKSWFLVVPLGIHACINLSDSRPKSNFIAYESLEIIKRIFLSLKSLERRLIDVGFKQGAALQKLRSKRGDGQWNEEIGSIFVDINDYSQKADQFGNAFSEFVSRTYIPAFVKAVSKYAVSEHLVGDEIYFIVISDLISNETSLRSAVVECLLLIDSFVHNEGSELCIASGFSPLTVSVGASVGLGTIISDMISVRTTGKFVNHAKRLQEEAGKAGILIEVSSNLNFANTNFQASEQILIQKKKQVVLAQRLLRLRRPLEKIKIAS